MTPAGEKARTVPAMLYAGVWAALVCLTLVTVGACYADLAHMAVFAAILIATTKATLVVLYFMHIRFERMLFTVMILVALGTYAIFLIMTFADYFYR